MKRTVLVSVLILLGLGFLGWAIAQSTGYVLITYGRFRYESSFWVFLAFILCLWLLAVLLRTVLVGLHASGVWINPWSRRRRAQRAERAARLGARELAEGQWSAALDHLRLAAEHDREPLVHYLGAARAASELGRHDESDELLRKAEAREPQSAVVIALAQAQLQIDRNQYDAARATLLRLLEHYPRHGYALTLLQQLYVQLEDWTALCALLPELRKQRVLPAERLEALERLAWIAALEQAADQPVAPETDPIARLDERWQAAPSGLRNDPALVAAYAQGLHRRGASARAGELLSAALKRQYDERLVELYGVVEGRDPARQLALAEGWLKARPESPVLLLALGRLSMRNQLWGKARDYLEASLRFEQKPQTCAELAALLAQLGESERSNRLYQEGFGLLSAPTPVQSHPVPLRQA